MEQRLADETQQAFYVVSETERLKRIDDTREEYIAIQRLVAKNIEQRRALRQRERETYAAFIAATGGTVQRSLEDVEDDDEALAAQVANTVVPITAAKRSEMERNKIIAQAIAQVRQSGGRLENTRLASALGINSHGLNGYLSHTDKLRKEYVGRESNAVCVWVLT